MAKIKILDQEKSDQERYPLTYVRKLVLYQNEWNGDRVRIFTYYLNFDDYDLPKVKKDYFQLSAEEYEIFKDLVLTDLFKERKNQYERGELKHPGITFEEVMKGALLEIEQLNSGGVEH